VLAIKDTPMIGSTIIAEKDLARLAEITSVDDLDDFTCLELDTMTTLDFQTIVGEGGVKWAKGKPIQYDPDSGMAIFQIDEKGLSFVLSSAEKLNKAQQADIRKLADFVKANGSSHIYEFATF
jgi:hypothetical protein